MRAVEFQEYGGPEVLRLVQVGAPEPGPGQVSIDAAWAGVNFADIKARAEGYRVASLPYRPGLEVSGRVRAVGEGVEGLTIGQEATALVDGGGYAEVVLAEAAAVFPLPGGLDLRTAATLPTVLPTAYGLIHEVGRLQAGESVLVHSAAGGIGTVAGQLARAAGAARCTAWRPPAPRPSTPSSTATTRSFRPRPSTRTSEVPPVAGAST